ncbi:MAG: hypothetical protein C4547_13405 [Phycisphaerales bacterium]|nr:MAG: hypothetical protein C4547_13405 [Phycisphaerales bacterium]
MKIDFRTLILLGCSLLVLFGAAVAEAQDKTFIGEDFDPWNVGASWNPPGEPGPDDDVLIPNNVGNRYCVIPEDYTDAACKSLTIEAGAKLILEDGSQLTLGANDAPNSSNIEGLLEVGEEGDPLSAATLTIGDDHTMYGDGGVLFVNKLSTVDYPDGEDPTLTLTHNCQGELGPTCSFMMRGGGNIEVGLVNNAIVRADLPWAGDPENPCPMYLQDQPKSGSGSWRAKGAGQLIVETSVTGSAHWRLSNPADGHAPEIHVDSCLNGLSGDVDIRAGLFRLTETFCTTGNLTWVSTDYDSTISWTSSGIYALFGVDTASSCPSCGN